MKKTRQLHLWIGLICSVFILLQSITGLLLTEKWILGGGEEGGRPDFSQMQQAQPAAGSSDQAAASTDAQQQGPGDAGGGPMMGLGGEGGGSMMFIKNLHEGRIGSTDVSILISLTAVGMIILTLTGIILSVKTLRAQSKSRKKRLQVESAA